MVRLLVDILLTKFERMNKNLPSSNNINESTKSNDSSSESYQAAVNSVPRSYSLIIDGDALSNIMLYAHCQIVIDNSYKSRAYLFN